MKIANLFWMTITFICLSGFTPEARSAAKNTNTTIHDKAKIEQTAIRRRRRIRRISYRIPALARANNRSRIITARGSATRNGLNSNENFQTIVAPNHVANTISSHPTFAVYFPEAKGNYVVALEEKGRKFNKIVWQQNLSVDKAGIKTITLPANKVGLQAGIDYRLSVQKVVNSNDRSQDIVAQVWMQKVELSPEIRRKIDNIKDLNDQAIELANQGVWFDTVALLVNQNDRASRKLLANLLEQVGLQEVEKVVTVS